MIPVSKGSKTTPQQPKPSPVAAQTSGGAPKAVRPYSQVFNVAGGPVKSGFGRQDKPGARTAHISGRDASYDSYAKSGTPIAGLPAGGTVSRIGRNRDRAGNSVYLDYGGGAGVEVYHLGSINAAPGQKVTEKDVIGSVGSSGYSPSGAHASYKFYKDGKVVPGNVAFPNALFPETQWGKQGGGSWSTATSFDPKSKTFYEGDKAISRPDSFSAGVSSATSLDGGFSGQQVNLGALNQHVLRRRGSTLSAVDTTPIAQPTVPLNVNSQKNGSPGV